MTEGLGPELPQDQAPGQVTGLKASTQAGQVNLSWSGVSGATAYHVKRSLVSGSGYTTIATVNGTNYADSSVVNGTAYYYVITAVNTAGEGIASFEVQATPFTEEPSNPHYPPSGGTIQPEQQPEPQDTVWMEASTTMSKGADGQSLATVIVNEEALKKAFRTLKLSQAATPTIAVEIADEGSAVIVNLPLQALLAELAASSNAVLSVRTSEGEYSLSLDKLGLSSFTLQLDQSLEDAKLKIAIKPVNGNAATKIAHSAASVDAAILSGAIAYSVSIQASGSDIPLKNYAGYATRTITVDLPVDLKHLAAVMYNPETGALTFAPASFKIADGKVTATLKRADNQIYMIISKKKTFSDLQGHWAKADVELLASKLIIKGAAADHFAPDHSITRAEFATLLVRALGLKEEGAPQFRDVAQTAWYAEAIGAAAASGIVKGYADGTFAPNSSITREEMAVMIARALSSTGAGTASSTVLEKFDDSSQISGWARSAAAQAVEAGIIKGVTDQSFVPAAKATRAEAAVMLKRLLQTVKFID
ncbi:S-layer homology domain-containing protein [Paenibacillus sp. GXUN7292]|uniref:S-layer homology domain-containing protein n=1 Tax=Paenibacillus sp. GXUN7292 TaxID=3422499 RepID=UPI003D7C3A91